MDTIPRELWLFVLAVVYRKNLTKKWVSNMSIESRLNRFDYAHILDETLVGFPNNKIPRVRHGCLCPDCVSVFDPFFQWVRIR